MKSPLLHRLSLSCVLVAALLAAPAYAQSRNSNASTLSLAVSVIVPSYFISEGGRYVVKGVEASAEGTVYVLEKLGEGVRASVTVGANVSGAASISFTLSASPMR